MKKILVLGATGAIGRYTVKELLRLGYEVIGVSLDDAVSDHPSLSYRKGNAKDVLFFDSLLRERWDGIVDFMWYPADTFRENYEKLLNAAEHYVYLSSYRVYANEEIPIKETSPRLLDVSKDEEYLASDDYSLYKARGEDLLRASAYQNWTAVRPAITYSRDRYQLVTLEYPLTVARADAGKPVVLPREARDVPATMSWAGDVGRMIARLLFLPQAMREIYTVSTSESHTWGEIASYYERLVGMKCVWVDKEDYLRIIDGDTVSAVARRQLELDRLFSRVIDNGKILSVVGMRQEELMPLYEGLSYELARRTPIADSDHARLVDERITAFLASRPDLFCD